jgi:hypothetical protein
MQMRALRPYLDKNKFRLSENRYWKLLLWIPDQVGNDKCEKQLQALLEAVFSFHCHCRA